jgi:hypothetical protein
MLATRLPTRTLSPPLRKQGKTLLDVAVFVPSHQPLGDHRPACMRWARYPGSADRNINIFHDFAAMALIAYLRRLWPCARAT